MANTKAILKPTGYRSTSTVFPYWDAYLDGARQGRKDEIAGLSASYTRNQHYNRAASGSVYKTGFEAGYDTENT